MPSGVILHAESDTHTAKIYQAALLGIVVWDWLVSLRSEYRHIWQGKPSVPKFLYIVARYVCLALTVLVFAIQFVDLPLEQCRAFVRANCVALTVIQVTSISVVTQRVWAVFMNSRCRYWVIGILLLLDGATLLFGIIHAAMAVSASDAPMVEGRGFCQVQVHDHWHGFTAAFFAMPILAHTIATAAVAWGVNPLPNTNAVKRLLVVDGLFYLLGVNSVGILQLIFFYQTMSDSLKMLNSAALLSLTAVFCCRFMLHLREEAEEINRNPFGRSPESSEMSKLSSSEKGSKTSLFKRVSARAGTGGRGTGNVTLTSEPDTMVGEVLHKTANPVHFVTVQHQVEETVEDMTDKEKEYTRTSRERHCSVDSLDEK